MRRLLLSLIAVALCGCASGFSCDKSSIDEEVLLNTAKSFVMNKTELAGKDEMVYSVDKITCGYIVTAAPDPSSPEFDVLIFIDGLGVHRVNSLGGPVFDARGDQYHGLPRSRPYPLVR